MKQITRATLDGIELEYEVWGAGEPVVLVHAGVVTEWFKPLLQERALIGRYQVVSYHRLGYAGEAVTQGADNPLRFTPDRGFAKSLVGRAALTIDVNRSLTVETAVRSAGSFVRFEYSQTFGQHWRATPGMTWIRGDATDFLGQYRHNSYLSLAVRYSF